MPRKLGATTLAPVTVILASMRLLVSGPTLLGKPAHAALPGVVVCGSPSVPSCSLSEASDQPRLLLMGAQPSGWLTPAPQLAEEYCDHPWSAMAG